MEGPQTALPFAKPSLPAILRGKTAGHLAKAAFAATHVRFPSEHTKLAVPPKVRVVRRSGTPAAPGHPSPTSARDSRHPTSKRARDSPSSRARSTYQPGALYTSATARAISRT